MALTRLEDARLARLSYRRIVESIVQMREESIRIPKSCESRIRVQLAVFHSRGVCWSSDFCAVRMSMETASGFMIPCFLDSTRDIRENTMAGQKKPRIPLPKGWTSHVRSAVLHVIALAQYATVYTRSWAANSLNDRVRLKAENDRLSQEIAFLEEEIHVAGYPLSSQIQMVWLTDGDHSFKPRKASGKSLDDNIAEAMTRITKFLDAI